MWRLPREWLATPIQGPAVPCRRQFIAFTYTYFVVNQTLGGVAPGHSLVKNCVLWNADMVARRSVLTEQVQTWELGAEVGQGGVKDAMSIKWQGCSVSEKTETYRQLGTGSSSLTAGDGVEDMLGKPSRDHFLRNGDKTEELGRPQRQSGGLVSVFRVLIYILEMGERNLLAFTDKRKEISRVGEIENECKWGLLSNRLMQAVCPRTISCPHASPVSMHRGKWWATHKLSWF